MRSTRNTPPGGRPNPLRQLIAEKQRDAELARSHQHVERLKGDLPSIVSEQVDQQMERLESKLVEEFKELGQRAAEQSAQVLTEQLAGRLDTLEQISALQSRSIQNLTSSSRVAEKKVGDVVDNIERALSDAVPGGFQLEPLQSPSARRPEFATELVKADTREVRELDDMPPGKYVFCPNCTSTKVRRAYRQGLWEEFLRLFFIAPFRCRACRHKFYRL